ncbi:response regulator [cf. Phormidesmis sp. LEGE 11477]|uniref:response regulator n=1 Tax=cf. Phormidesmis sp. LEGE 11477 TaxID=1828680 RepID=UPI00187EA391|nr:response regulator [cf. Phormidesmis sp. LEGE 11477]MBE9063092.1 response regulator [cf. Phormidesmis sp. LEGE 11477]
MQLITDPLLLLKNLILKVDTSPDLASALPLVVQTICTWCRWNYGEAWQLDPKTHRLTNQTTFCNIDSDSEVSKSAANCRYFEQLSQKSTFALGEGIPGRVWSSGQWEWHTDVSAVDDEVFVRTEAATAYGFRATFGIPLLAGDHILAVLLFSSTETLPKSPQLIEIIEIISITLGRLIQRRQNEESLQDSDNRLRAFMDNSDAMVFMKDSKGCFTYVNQPLEREFRLQPDELIGKDDFYLSPKEAANQVRENDAMVLSTNQSQALTEVVPTPDGVDRYWRVNKFPFADQLGQRYVGGMAFDITQQKQLEERLMLEQLEQQRVNESLVAATKAAEAATKAKSSFLAMMSHEIRTPMNAMLGMTELLGDTGLDAQQQDFVNVIQTGGNTLLAVINDILDFSKIESDNLELEAGRFDLYECVEQVLTLFSSQAEEKGLSLTSVIEPIGSTTVPAYFEGDEVRLRQILSNLVSNGIKFTQKGGVSIQASINPVAGGAQITDTTKRETKPEYELQFLIKDTGIGIDQEKITHLFKPFSQADTSMTRRYGGTGLGLAISRQLVELMGGKIDVASDLGEGSTFRFSVRLSGAHRSSLDRRIHTQIGLERKRLLIIDSHEVSRKSLALQAQSWNLIVEVAASAEAALVKLFCPHKFDAITIDESVLELGSTQSAAQVRDFLSYSTVPLILLQTRSNSALASPLLGDKTTRLLKPIRRSQFYNALVQLLEPEAGTWQSDVGSGENGEREDDTDSGLEDNSGAKLPADTLLSAQKPLHILLAEDILLNQKVALQMLATYGYQADVVGNGKEAIAALQKRPYDLVLMDVQMPEMDGLEATQKIRLDSECEQPYIVAMTAHAMQGDRENCLSAGMNDYVRKPIRRRDLAMVLQQCPFDRKAKQTNAPEQRTPQVESCPDLPILDTTIIESLDTDSAFLKEVCDGFVDDAPKRMKEIQFAIDQADAIALADTAHALKSLSGCVGAMSLFHLCQSVEAVGRSNCIEPALPLMVQVVGEYEKVQVAIQTYKEGL